MFQGIDEPDEQPSLNQTKQIEDETWRVPHKRRQTKLKTVTIVEPNQQKASLKLANKDSKKAGYSYKRSKYVQQDPYKSANDKAYDEAVIGELDRIINGTMAEFLVECLQGAKIQQQFALRGRNHERNSSFKKQKSSIAMPGPCQKEDIQNLDDAIFQMFKSLDVDGSGSITQDELHRGMRNFGMNPTDNEINIMMNILDADGDGSVDLKEFAKVANECFRLYKFTDLKFRNVFFTLSLFSPKEKKDYIKTVISKYSLASCVNGISERDKADLDEVLDCLCIALEDPELVSTYNGGELEEIYAQWT